MKQTMFAVLGVSEWLIAVIIDAIKTAYDQMIESGEELLPLVNPPKADMGDVAAPCFLLAKLLKRNPAEVAARLAAIIKPSGDIQEVCSAGPYLNFFLSPGRMAKAVVERIFLEGANYGCNRAGDGQRIMIEYSGPNSNKAMHLGHLRNNQLGIALCNIMTANGYHVIPVNIINDRGIAICRSMVAYRRWADGQTPASAGKKGDHLVGELYARFMEEAEKELVYWLESRGMSLEAYGGLDEAGQKTLTKEFEAQSPLIREAFEMLRQWEANDPQTRQLWQTMNGWVYEGFNQTYARQGVAFEQVYLESDTYELGRRIVFDHLAHGLVQRDENSNIVIDLTAEGLDCKVLVRADGTTVYITQDIGTAVLRFQEYEPLDRLIYVVANEQKHHFQVLFKMLAKFGYPWAGRCFHRSYGMVNLPTGKMSSRKLKQGGVFLADELMDQLQALARTAILERNPEMSGSALEDRAEMIGLAALKYWLLKTNPDNDVTFVPEESLKFEGNTGPYLQYAYARINSILQKAESQTIGADLSMLVSSEELTLVKSLASFPGTVEAAAADYNPALVANQIYEIAKAFSQWYNSCSILSSDTSALKNARIFLARATAVVLENSLRLLGIESPQRM